MWPIREMFPIGDFVSSVVYRLLLKLKVHGIGDDIIDSIEKWLTDRRQRVVVDGEVSNWKSVLSEVPQGSALEPSIFLTYI